MGKYRGSSQPLG